MNSTGCVQQRFRRATAGYTPRCWMGTAALLLSAGLLAASGAYAGEVSAYGPGWSTAHADASNTNYVPVAGIRDLKLAWQRDLGGSINLGATSDPTGRVYVTTSGEGCHLYVLDRDTGETIWCSDKLDRFAVSSSALIDRDGHAYLADSKAMHAFDRDGKILWETPIVGVPLSAQFTPSGHLIFTTNIGRIYVLRRDTGALVLPSIELIPGAVFDPSKGRACMRGTEDCPSANTLAVDKTGRFFFTFWEPGKKNAGLRAMQYRDGPKPSIELLWVNDSLPGGSASSPVLSADGTRVYVNDNVESIHAIDTATGKNIWSFAVGYEAGGCAAVTPEGLIMPAGGGKGVIMALADKGDHAEQVWRLDTAINRGIPTQVAGNISYAAVAAGMADNDLLVLDTKTGAELDRERLPGKPFFTIGTTVGPDGTVYVPTIRGQIYAYRAAGKDN
ncbi:PQQ-binding-like beta-propeller repeat protein [Parvibaculum sp.]|uniref:outer membrane protein assembly factor BamB family protein n=1 Tax=Parvibaculum sp. TaxID=2024848 RepID=UPI002CC280F6|nr:PQQ-binding-like beta-propeller repeat protein [Parvibaculum sp.]HUD52492.1 PQQ-binding-like beta-propeller repeat protein [Parvibaculum sp.]